MLFPASAPPRLLFHPAVALGVQTAISAGALGLRSASSHWWLSVLTVPAQVGCVGVIIYHARDYVRPAWAAWVASFSVSTLLRCLGQCFLSGKRLERNAEEGKDASLANESPRHPKDGLQVQREIQRRDLKGRKAAPALSIWKRYLINLDSLMDFRHLNSADEAKNTPTFSYKDTSYVPSRGRFLVISTIKAIFSYLVIDLLTGSPLPPTVLTDFAPERMLFFTRLRSVTVDELITRFVLPVSVFTVGACLLELSHEVLAIAAVVVGYHEPRDWRPQFGSPSMAFTLRNFWGEVWHQNLRITYTTWSDYVAHNILGMPRSSNRTSRLTRLFVRYTKQTLVFGLSGLVHLAAEVASGVPATRSRANVFFLCQALGIMAEDAFQAGYSSSLNQPRRDDGRPTIGVRLFGYAWVLSFMAWSIPWWIYPPTYDSALKGLPPRSLIPFSVIRWRFT